MTIRRLKIFIPCLILSCSNGASDNSRAKKESIEPTLSPALFPNLTGRLNSKYLSIGAIQGVEESNLLYGKLLASVQNDGDSSYVIYFLPRISSEKEITRDWGSYWEVKRTEILNHFHFILFRYPFSDDNKQEEFHESDIDFPCRISAYQILDGRPAPRGSKVVESFEELSEFKSQKILELFEPVSP